MRGAAKGEEPEDLRAWKEGEVRAGLKPRYEALGSDLLRTLKQALLKEQTGQCVYCGGRIRIAPTGNEHDEECHIEHFRPRADYQELEVDYDNLFLSCNGGRHRRDGKAGTCGHRKADWFDEDCHVAPIPEKEGQQRFVFGGDGRVGGDGTAAEKMIEVLNLNAPGLVHDRSKLIEGLEGQLEEDEDAGMGASIVRELISDYEATKHDGTRDGFTHVAVRYLHQYLRRP